ncbi:hypothetical protein DCS_06930 [Drechmeria coniospora]|uniref:BSD domain-containing protein n=1 Tax=Drechmeria coniospora TaxID=98403 RepID=A0A151GCZ4_DRECN|nr:hypothetical protein DCS_06930 [Drechmeria coniospora]KYK54969.1 hypothetical protein DCS_06930 [Drechmeria coniospora]
MDLTYDHIQVEAYSADRTESTGTPKPGEQSSLNDDIQDAYKAISSSPWGLKIGDFLGNVVKQGESVYTQAQKELAEVSGDASKGLTDLRETILNQTRSLSINRDAERETTDGDDAQSTPTQGKHPSSEDATQHSETVLARLRSEAAKRLKDLQRAEDAADEALLRFGTNMRDFLRDAIAIAPPDHSDEGSTVLFESTDAQGKRVIHASRFDAQLHVIHTSPESFTRDPSGDEFETWAKDFDVDKKTGDISNDLAQYPELQTTMEKVVPEQIPYADFWKRYYYLRHTIETAENRRRDLLNAAKAEDEVAWDDSDDDATKSDVESTRKAATPSSSNTVEPPEQKQSTAAESRKSNDEKSQADSEASYDVVGEASGETSRGPDSPKELKKDDDSDDDWE